MTIDTFKESETNGRDMYDAKDGASKGSLVSSNVCKGCNKSTGKACGRKVTTSEFCWQHENQSVVNRVKKEYKTPLQHRIDNAKVKRGDIEEIISMINEKIEEETDIKKINEYAVSIMFNQQKIDELCKFINGLEEEKKTKDRLYYKTKHAAPVEKSMMSYKYKAPSEKTLGKVCERELKMFQSKQRNFEYRKNKNKVI